MNLSRPLQKKKKKVNVYHRSKAQLQMHSVLIFDIKLTLLSNVSDILGLGGVCAEQTATRQVSATNVHILE